MTNSIDALNLYAKIEDLIGVKDVAPKLYSYYLDILNSLEFDSLLDIGCGKGDFLKDLKIKYPNCYLEGIDRSTKMVKEAKKIFFNVSTKELKDLDTKFKVATATFDMVNYLTPDEFTKFFKNLKEVIEDKGYFIFDVNTKFGLSELAVGNFIAEDEDRFLAIESFYEDNYISYFTLFEKIDSLYKKTLATIKQYYYSNSDFLALKDWKVVNKKDIKLYDSDFADKTIYILQRA